MSISKRRSRLSWICRTDAERERFFDMHRRLLPINTVLLVVVIVLVAPFWWSYEHLFGLVPTAGAIALFAILQRHATRFARPEVWVYLALLATEAAIGSAVVLAGVQHTGALALLCWPVVGVCGRFRALPAILGSVYAGVVVVVCQIGFGASTVFAQPLGLTVLLAALICVTALTMSLRESDVEHRGAAALDPLTGLLNRRALMRRARELEEQSRLHGQPIGLIVADLDHFKAVNDTYGHGVGDEVLRHIADLLRRELRAYDLAYRLGGEELAVILLGSDLDATAQRAEELRAVIAGEPYREIAVTASFGVSASEPGEAFSWSEQFPRADAALYEAKRLGRDAVCRAPAAVELAGET